MKICTTCKRTLTTDNFYRIKTRNDILYSECKNCFKKKINNRNQRFGRIVFSRIWFQKRYSKLRARARLKKRKFLLSPEEFQSLRRKNKCVYCRVGEGVIFSIDRKDNSIGYIGSNCVLACLRCNKMKSDLLTYDEMLILGRALSKIDKSRRPQN